METSLLKTKLYVPPPRPNLVTRPRLTERLNEGLTSRLTLISAPAGFGKTTLLSEWIHSSEWPVAWVSLDEGDNDVARFLTYFIAALQTIVPGIGEAVLVGLQSPQSPPLESMLTVLINDVVQSGDTFVLVLDDYHVIEASEIDRALTFLLDHLPPYMHLMIASRVTPSLPLSRWRANREMIELRTDDLRFTPDEVAVFLNQMVGLELSIENVVALEDRTEGWIAGLQLAALSMQGLKRKKEVAAFIAAFTGNHRYVLDYLTDEVLRQCPLDTTDFLLQTSILKRMSGPLCNAVTGRDDGCPVLEELENTNMFVVPLDNERHWYRYHHLFADLLQQRLQRTSPDDVADLHRRASQWYEQNNLVTEALDHALAAADFDRAARLVAENAQPMFMRGEVATVRDWFAALPPEIVRRHPRLSIDQAWALYFVHRPNAIEPFLRDAERELRSGDVAGPATISVWQGEVIALRAWVKRCQGDLEQSIELSRQALGLLSEKEMFVRCLNILNMAGSLCLTGDSMQAAEALSDCVCSCKEAGSPLGVVAGAYDLAELLVRQGHLQQAKVTLQEALQWATGQGVHQLPATAPLHIGLGDVLREQNEAQAAGEHLRTGIEMAELGYKTISGQGYLSLAHLRLTQGDVDGAHKAFRKAERAMQGWETPQMMANLMAHRVHLWLVPERGDFAAAVRWAGEQQSELLPSRDDTETALPEIVRLTTLARVLLAQARQAGRRKASILDQAVTLLKQLRQVAEADNRMGRVIEILALQALVLQERDDVDEALVALKRALSLAEPEGYVRVFVDEGEPMARLLYEATRRGILPAYTGKLLAAFELAQDAASRSVDCGSPPAVRPSAPLEKDRLIEPLTERQLEVLQLIAGGLSNQEIARELVLSLNTVKGHTRKIYGKLSVNSRTQAVAKAQALGILPSV